MAQSLTKNYIHLIFATRDRADLLRKNDLPTIHRYIAGTLSHMGCPAIKVGGTTNHIHALFVLNKTLPLSKVVEDMKRNTSKWVKELNACYKVFSWQHGYGAFSVSQSKVDVVKRYIENQNEHHKQVSFTDELKRFLDEYGITYDEQYL